MKTMRTIASFALVLGLVAISGQAHASGAALDASVLPAKTQSDLRAEIAKARAETPELFRQVQDVASHAREIDAKSRRPGLPLTMHFKSLGNRAFYPMLDLLVFDAHTEPNLPTTAASALRVGLIEAVGAIRDARSVPVMAHLVQSARELETVTAASEALAKVGSDEALAALTSAVTQAHGGDGNARERAILTGMHDARRESAARFLADRLDAKPDAATAKVLAKSLGGVGNAWAWKTLTNQSEADASRRTAAAALVRAFVAYDGEARDAAGKALLVVDDPSTAGLLAKAKVDARRDVVLALEGLEQRLAHNPTR